MEVHVCNNAVMYISMCIDNVFIFQEQNSNSDSRKIFTLKDDHLVAVQKAV